PRTRNLTSVRASRSMSGWDGPVASRSLAVRPRCLGCARGCRYPPLPSSTLDNAAAVIAADGSVAKIVKLEHAWRRLDGRNDDGFQVAPFPG
ncbi:hypothetical protein AAIH12_35500, partial [Pseudomonas aeruginosa]